MKKLFKKSGLPLVVLISGFNLAQGADSGDPKGDGSQGLNSPTAVTSNLPSPTPSQGTVQTTSAPSDSDNASAGSASDDGDTASISSAPSSVSIASSHPSDTSSVTMSDPESDYDTDNQSVASDGSTGSNASTASNSSTDEVSDYEYYKQAGMLEPHTTMEDALADQNAADDEYYRQAGMLEPHTTMENALADQNAADDEYYRQAGMLEPHTTMEDALADQDAADDEYYRQAGMFDFIPEPEQKDDDFVPNINSLYGEDATEHSNQDDNDFDEEAMWRNWPETGAAKEAAQSEAVVPSIQVTSSPRPSRDAVYPDVEVKSTPGKPGRFKSLAKSVAKLKSNNSYKLIPNECQCTCSSSSDQSIVNQQIPAVSATQLPDNASDNQGQNSSQPVAAASSKYDDVVSTAGLYGDEDEDQTAQAIQQAATAKYDDVVSTAGLYGDEDEN